MAKIFLQNQGIDIGAEKEMPEYIKEWHTKTSDFRQLYTAECMLSLGADQPIEQRLKKAKEIFEKDTTSAWFRFLAKNYLENKEKQTKILEDIIKTYEKTVLGQVF